MEIRTGKAKRELTCEGCKKAIHEGECLVRHSFRERALSYHEAMHAGTWDVTRRRYFHTSCAPTAA